MSGFKAEMVLACYLVVRHRAPQIAAAVALSIGFLIAVARPAGGAMACRLLLLAAGVFGAVAASRPLAGGAALATARRAVTVPWIVVAGRFAGVSLLMACVAVVVAAGVMLQAGAAAGMRALVAGMHFGLATVAIGLGLAPRTGASVAAALGVAVACSALATGTPFHVTGGGPIGTASLTVWHVLPLPWRGAAWFDAGGVGHLGVLIAWVVGGLWLAAAAVRARERSS